MFFVFKFLYLHTGNLCENTLHSVALLVFPHRERSWPQTIQCLMKHNPSITFSVPCTDFWFLSYC